VYILFFAFAFGAWLWHKLIRPAHRRRCAYTVREVRKETADIWTIRLTPPDCNRFRHREGQFGFIRFLTGNVSREPHPFSFSDMQDDHGTLTMTIKALGDYTRAIRNAKPGDLVAVDGPYGRFTPSLHGHKKLVLLAGGIGITPMLSILGHLRHTDPTRPVLLIWGINHSDEFIRRDFFADLQEHMDNYRFVPVAFREPGFDGEQGAIDRERLERLTRAHGFDGKETGFYLCGPAPMMNMAAHALKGMGIPAERIHHEMFSL
jgi:ferredoxin-NADP reductase